MKYLHELVMEDMPKEAQVILPELETLWICRTRAEVAEVGDICTSRVPLLKPAMVLLEKYRGWNPSAGCTQYNPVVMVLLQMQHILLILMEKAFQHTFGFFQLVSDPLWNLLF